MNKILPRLSLVVALILINGCAATAFRAPVKPPVGLLFTQYKAPLSTDFDNTTLGTKTGRASTFFFWEPYLRTSYAWGKADIEATLEAARRKGGITTVTHADYEYLNVIGIFAMFTVEAHGE